MYMNQGSSFILEKNHGTTPSKNGTKSIYNVYFIELLLILSSTEALQIDFTLLCMNACFRNLMLFINDETFVKIRFCLKKLAWVA